MWVIRQDRYEITTTLSKFHPSLCWLTPKSRTKSYMRCLENGVTRQKKLLALYVTCMLSLTNEIFSIIDFFFFIFYYHVKGNGKGKIEIKQKKNKILCIQDLSSIFVRRENLVNAFVFNESPVDFLNIPFSLPFHTFKWISIVGEEEILWKLKLRWHTWRPSTFFSSSSKMLF